jgi:tetratricopeptide (TPR) repeat protein
MLTMRSALTLALLLAATLLAAPPAFASSAEPLDDPSVDPAACRAAAAAAPLDADRVIALCSKVIDARETGRDDRVKALVARATAYARKQQIDRAIVDHDDALRLDPHQPDLLNARGELWLAKGDRRKALADFAAAVKAQPDHAAARANHKALALEVERLGAQKAIEGKPSFDCARARHRVERAICADPALARLDREIYALALRVQRDAAGKPAELRTLKRQHAAFVAERNARFGHRGYDLKAAMQARLRQLAGADGY